MYIEGSPSREWRRTKSAKSVGGTMKHPAKVVAELERAKTGHSGAADFICRYVWETYGGRIFGLFSNDVADDRDDLQQIFWLAVAGHLPKLDHRGDPVYHLGQRGF